jgi:hypothetical protein
MRAAAPPLPRRPLHHVPVGRRSRFLSDEVGRVATLALTQRYVISVLRPSSLERTIASQTSAAR